jgi:hypothetical protein
MSVYDSYDDVDPDSEEFIEELRKKGMDDEQIEQAQEHVRYFKNLSPEQREAQEEGRRDVSMGMSLTPKWANSIDIAIIDNLAEKRNYNRRISDEGLEALDPEGTHLLIPWMIHRHAMGEDVPAHMRCQVWLKVKGQDPNPDDVQGEKVPKIVMDVPMELWLQLNDAHASDEDAMAQFQDEVWRVILGGD